MIQKKNPILDFLKETHPYSLFVLSSRLKDHITFVSDADECRINHGGCEFSCNNTESSYYCSCRSGYRLAADKHACEDIDECQTLTHQCPGKDTEMILCQSSSLTPEGPNLEVTNNVMFMTGLNIKLGSVYCV